MVDVIISYKRILGGFYEEGIIFVSIYYLIFYCGGTISFRTFRNGTITAYTTNTAYLGPEWSDKTYATISKIDNIAPKPEPMLQIGSWPGRRERTLHEKGCE